VLWLPPCVPGERAGDAFLDDERDEVREREPLPCIMNGALGGRSGISTIGMAANWGSMGIKGMA
jgi:hypothetical protein